MEIGFEEANSNNLPEVDYSLILDFYKNNPDYMNAESRGHKDAKATRKSYGDAAVGYVQVSRNREVCRVLAKITPEHKVRQAGYKVEVEINETENIIKKCVCQDCPASVGGCKHAIAFLFWLHRRSEEPSVTETVCYWKKSELSKVGTNKKFIKLTDLDSSAKVEPCNDNWFLKKVLEKDVDNSIIFNLHRQPSNLVQNLSLHNLMFEATVGKKHNNAVEFLNFCTEVMTDVSCETAYKLTSHQSKSTLWHELRYGRITASKIYEASKCKTEDGSLVERIFGATKFSKTDAMERGLRLEDEVLSELGKDLNIKIGKCGLILLKNIPALGASPDGISDNYYVEIKCPTKKKNISYYVQNGIIQPKFLAQVQMQMHFCSKKEAVFVVADPDFEVNKNISKYFVSYDEGYCKTLIDDAMDFWKRIIFPKFPVCK